MFIWLLISIYNATQIIRLFLAGTIVCRMILAFEMYGL